MSGKDHTVTPAITAILVSVFFIGGTAVACLMSYQVHRTGKFHGILMSEARNVESAIGSLLIAAVSLWAALRMRSNRVAAYICGLIAVAVLAVGCLLALAYAGVLGEQIDTLGMIFGFIFGVIPLLTLGFFAVLSSFRHLRSSTSVSPPPRL